MGTHSTESSNTRQRTATDPFLRSRDERLSSLKSLASRLVHDFNNFLVPLFGYIDLIRDDQVTPQKIVPYIEGTERAARKTEALLEKLTTSLHPQRNFTTKSVALDEILQKELVIWHQAQAKASHITIQHDIQPATTLFDEKLWEMVIQNLLQNAHYALATGGNLQVFLHPYTLSSDETERLGLISSTGWTLVIHDHGLGMSPDDLHRALEPFFSTRPKNQALGLGLSAIHNLIRWFGGQIEITSQVGEGTRVTLWIPQSQIPIPTLSHLRDTPSPLSDPAKSEKQHILLVDDDPLVLDVVKICLQREKYEVQTAADGAIAWRYFQMSPNKWSLVLSDIVMPKTNGIELAQKIQTLSPQTPIVLITGNLDLTNDKILQEFTEPAPPIIRKPFPLPSLTAYINKILRPVAR